MIKLFNTLTKSLEEFSPIEENKVRMYTCGPTVYNYPHIGNYRAYIFADILKRTLSYNGYEVKHVMNLTDVDDKTIRESQKSGKTLKEFTEFYGDEFKKDIASLNIINPDKFTKATEYIDSMVEIIEKLLEKGLAYKSNDGSVYFNIKKFHNYGKLSGIQIENQKENAEGRINTDEYEKDNVQDFALWKAWDEKDGEVFWETKLGKGRPGWHIECSAMSMTNLGEEIDIHTGGVDLIFPHHENEIAQSEGVTGKNFSKYWIHNEHLMVEGKKMAKSLNNFYTLRDITEKNINPLSFRLLLLSASYRTRMNFTWENLEGLDNSLKKLHNFYLELGGEVGEVNTKYKEKFRNYINEDLDTPKAVALLWDLVKDDSLSNQDKKATIIDFDKVLGLGFDKVKEEKIPEEVLRLVQEREQSRKDKNFTKSDELRKDINSFGYEVKDTTEGQKVSKL